MKKMVDWNKIPIDRLIEHLYETFMLDSSGTSKAVNELIKNYQQVEARVVVAEKAQLKFIKLANKRYEENKVLEDIIKKLTKENKALKRRKR